VCCKKTIARFFKNRFCNGICFERKQNEETKTFCNLGVNGKSIYFPDYGIWLTPIEFQEISGSTQADWKRAIHFTSVNVSFNSFKLSFLYEMKFFSQGY
jgi:hypothetical protein